jgi:hypothetical protein
MIKPNIFLILLGIIFAAYAIGLIIAKANAQLKELRRIEAAYISMQMGDERRERTLRAMRTYTLPPKGE